MIRWRNIIEFSLLKHFQDRMDFVVRTSYSTELENRIESKAESRQELSDIQDEFFKPEGTELPDFIPRDVIVRKRTFPDRETLVKINIIQKPTGYTDTKEDLESLDGYEKWGEFNSYAIEYKMEVEGEEIPILVETFDFGKFIKIESPSPEILESILQELNLSKTEIIEKNSAELLAEDMTKI